MTDDTSAESPHREMAERILGGDIRSAARLMRLVDDEASAATAVLDELFAHTGDAYIIGITGNPGSGKSTLVDRMIEALRAQDLTVGCVAIDPTSPFSGGAILGDRVRMQRHALDEGVFIRSVATRGNLGGLSRSTPAFLQILDAMGYDILVVETVGVGQAEVDIVRLADTSVVLTVPGLGDDIQAHKAGLLEIADLFVINKADRDGAPRLRRELRSMLDIAAQGRDEDDWRPPVLETVATTGEGVERLLDEVRAHRDWLVEHELLRLNDARRVEHYVRMRAAGRIERLLDAGLDSERWDEAREALSARSFGPDHGVDILMELVREALS
jgi:LAO/AO transport system kinase